MTNLELGTLIVDAIDELDELGRIKRHADGVTELDVTIEPEALNHTP
ncbi:hypothetical protein EVC03_091 [Rhizobium phage RHph_Y5A]|nr:hypothetical protein EVC03_091 [Rhizobium phage RHph_Y5A]QIG75533.1 hypothetical protein EVC18_091 [Rhizobium phage RHph_Y2_4]